METLWDVGYGDVLERGILVRLGLEYGDALELGIWRRFST